MIYTKEWAFIHIPKTSGTNFQIRMEDKEGVTNAWKNMPDIGFIVENEKKDLIVFFIFNFKVSRADTINSELKTI